MSKQLAAIKIDGTTELFGTKVPNISGGFGADKKAMLVRDIAKIHGRKTGHINQLINENRHRFVDSQHVIDFKKSNGDAVRHLIDKEEYRKSKNIFMLSEMGYMRLLKIMDDEVAWKRWDVVEKDYFEMKSKQEVMSYPDLLRAHADEIERREIAERELLIALPKAELCDVLTGSDDVSTVEEVAKIISKKFKCGRNTLFRILRDKGIFMSSNLPKQRFIEAEYFEVNFITYKCHSKEGVEYTKTEKKPFFTPRGIQYIVDVLQKGADKYIIVDVEDDDAVDGEE